MEDTHSIEQSTISEFEPGKFVPIGQVRMERTHLIGLSMISWFESVGLLDNHQRSS